MKEAAMSALKSYLRMTLIGPVLLGASLALSAGCYLGDFAGDYKYKESFSKTLPLPADGTFSLKNTNGVVRVSTWSQPEVEIKAEKSASREGDLELLKIEIDSGAREVKVDTIYPHRSFFRGKVTYDVRVPEGARLEQVQTTNGDVELTGRYSDVRAGTTNGDVRVETVEGSLVLFTTNGSIRAQDVVGRVKANTTNGGITLGLEEARDEIQAGTTNGSITLRVLGALNADLIARTTNGHVNTDFPITVQGTISSRRKIEGKIGSGGPQVELHTTNGSITIIKGGRS
jgi:DUF4097 and DUF4098 domain-containing protein YvlB